MKIGGSYYVALPRSWVSENIGDRGVVVLEAEEDGSLRITPLKIRDRREGAKSIRITCGGDLYRKLVSAYLRGFEVVEVAVSDECRDEVLRVVERARQILLGLEVVGEEPGTITLQCFTRPDYDLNSIVQRMSSITLSMLRLTFQALETGDPSLAEKVLAMDDIVDRLYFLAVRIIRSRVSDPMYPSSEKPRLVDIRLVVRNLENIGDLYEKLLRSGIQPEKVPGDLLSLLESLQRSAVALVLGESGSREGALELYSRLEKALEGNRTSISPRVLETLDGVSSLLRDILDLA